MLGSTSQEIFKNRWSKLLSRVTDIFDDAAAKYRLEKVCRSPWGEMNILPTAFVLLMQHKHFYEEHVLCEKSFGQGLKFSLSGLVGALQSAHVPYRRGHKFQFKELWSGLVGPYSLYKSPLYFSRICTFCRHP